MNEAERLAREAAEKAEQASSSASREMGEGTQKAGDEARQVYETTKREGSEAVERVRGTEDPTRRTTPDPTRPTSDPTRTTSQRTTSDPRYVQQQPSRETRGYYEEPKHRNPVPWILGGIGALAVAGLAAWGIWAAVDDDDDDDDSDVAGVQSESVDIDDGGFSEGDLEISVGDSVEFNHEGDEDCQLTANGASVATVSGGESYTWTAQERGVYLIQCEGQDDILEVTVEE
jgi:plastocyanin